MKFHSKTMINWLAMLRKRPHPNSISILARLFNFFQTFLTQWSSSIHCQNIKNSSDYRSSRINLKHFNFFYRYFSKKDLKHILTFTYREVERAYSNFSIKMLIRVRFVKINEEKFSLKVNFAFFSVSDDFT